MNFFKLYIGDYQRDTAHLSVTEHGAYLLMLQHYYATEMPLPVGKALHRMLRAQDKPERDAIDTIVEQFWTVTPDGLINERADVEITKAESQAETNARIARDRERKRKESREAHEQSTNRVTNDQPNHSHSQTPDLKPHSLTHAPTTSTGGTPAGAASARMRQAGLQDANPQHPKLRALLDAGITADELAQAATEAVQRGKGFAYALATAEGRRRDAAITPLPAQGASPGRGKTLTETRIDTIAGLTGQTQNPQENPHERDITAHAVRIA